MAKIMTYIECNNALSYNHSGFYAVYPQPNYRVLRVQLQPLIITMGFIWLTRNHTGFYDNPFNTHQGFYINPFTETWFHQLIDNINQSRFYGLHTTITMGFT